MIPLRRNDGGGHRGFRLLLLARCTSGSTGQAASAWIGEAAGGGRSILGGTTSRPWSRYSIGSVLSSPPQPEQSSPDADPDRRRSVVAGARGRRGETQPQSAGGGQSRSRCGRTSPSVRDGMAENPLSFHRHARLESRRDDELRPFVRATIRRFDGEPSLRRSLATSCGSREFALSSTKNRERGLPSGRSSASRRPGSRAGAVGLADAEQAVENQQRDAEIDRGVGEIENEEVPAERVQVEKIDDRAVGQSIVAVAERAADDRRRGRGRPGARARATARSRAAPSPRASPPAAANGRPPIPARTG